MHKLKNIFLFLLCGLFIAGSLYCLWVKDKYVIPIIMYHHINYSPVRRADTVSPEVFEKQMNFLKRHNYKVIGMDDFINAKKNGQKLDRKTVVITFDDGYEDNFTHAFKILKKYNFPAVFFIPPVKVGTEDRMSWEQLKEMIGAGYEIGSHTYNELYLPDLRLSQQKFEIFESKKMLEKELGVPIEHFAYPSGGFSEGIKALVRQAGYISSCATNRGYDKSNNNLFEIKRIRLNENNSEDYDLAVKLSGYYNHFRKYKRPY